MRKALAVMCVSAALGYGCQASPPAPANAKLASAPSTHPAEPDPAEQFAGNVFGAVVGLPLGVFVGLMAGHTLTGRHNFPKC